MRRNRKGRIVAIGGGDTFYMVDVWRKYDLDKKLKEVYLKDTAILAGSSAGAMCWFDCGYSNSKMIMDKTISGLALDADTARFIFLGVRTED